MWKMNIVSAAFHYGQEAEEQGYLDAAVYHYTRALETFHSTVGPSNDTIFWSKILFSRANVYHMLQKYSLVATDIQHALKYCPQQLADMGEAELWFSKGESAPPGLAVWYYSAALHFTAEDTHFRSQVLVYRAISHFELRHYTECDQDLVDSKKLNPSFAVQIGINVKHQAVDKAGTRAYERAVYLLQLAEKCLRPLDPTCQSQQHDWVDCWRKMFLVAWNGKFYARAIQAGKERRQIIQITNRREAIDWKDRGNEMFKQGKFDYAIDCYALSIHCIPMQDNVLLGTLYSNRSQAYLKKRLSAKAKQDAEKCLEYRPDWSKGFYRMGCALMALKDDDVALEFLCKGLNIPNQTEGDRHEIFCKIMTLIYNCGEDGPKKITFKLPSDCLNKFLRECVEKRHWKSLEVYMLGGGGEHCYAKGEGGVATGNCDLKEISLCDVIRANPKPGMYYELIAVLIDHGVLVNRRFSNEIPLSLAVNYDDHKLAIVLLKKDASPEGLLACKFGKQDDTPIHTAFRIGLCSGNWDIFHHLMEKQGGSTNSSTQCDEIVDRKGNSLYHLVASSERMWHHTVHGINLLLSYNLDPATRNNDGKTSLMMIRQRSDPRYHLIEEAVKHFAPDSSKKKNKRKKKNKKKERVVIPVTSKSKKNENKSEIVVEKLESPSSVSSVVVHRPSEIERLREAISEAIDHLPLESFTKESEIKSEVKEVGENLASNSVTALPLTSSDKAFAIETDATESKVPLPPSAGPTPDDDVENDDEPSDDVTFDKLTWEVECTSEVWKKLKDKKLPRDKKKKIVDIVRQLANGDMRGSNAKPLVGIAKESNILLFEAKLDKSARILWERAIAFSPRCSETSLPKKNSEKGGEMSEIYTEVIRIWDIVFDHDTVPRKIKKIIHSYNRGTNCFIKKNLKGLRSDNKSSSITNGQISVPNIYVPREDKETQTTEYLTTNDEESSSDEPSKMFFPPGSPEETEYHILKFYAFSNAMVNAMLNHQNRANCDFPFRVSELEHSVINLVPKSAILLLGRSGTGKTTCCLYRLWNNYQTYWQHHILSEPSIPKVALFVPRISEDVRELESTEGKKTSMCEGRDSARSCDASDDEQSCFSSSLVMKREQPCHSSDDPDVQAAGKQQAFEHLHQAFITKNAVLCKEVQKNFLELHQASFPSNDVKDHQPSSLFKFDELDEQTWPLFICSRDWLLMLDASLPGEPFFPRDENGDLLRNVKGWGKDDNNLQEIPVNYSDDEDDSEMEDNLSAEKSGDGDHCAEVEVDARCEITYQVFKNELWRKMTKKKKVDYHPSLVWTEIRSFIKGSVEALHCEDGYITLEEYQSIGRNRAPSFTANRESIYELFLSYQRIKRGQRMFDETDVVHSIYRRLKYYTPAWSIHEIYVDETQDFTQAELAVMIRSCRNPNRLFFTGDTAQSIMRGIAFRFCDLRSIFHYMKESVAAVGQEAQVEVPDRVYELTHNYRSHAGILNLASCITDLLYHFFPESFDRMARDQGLFEGPKPVILESCSFSDLAVILRGYKRKTSPIEFGAHQVILVSSDEVRDSLPEELSLALVMTIYEAKGLEFDDVLIYNFFKNSQAQKEWRVVGTYKETDDDDTRISATGIAEIPIDSLECKARPLEFNPEQHKILISEFKYLYTAITRARVNVWLFDESEEARTPMFEYFQRRQVVDVKKVQQTENDTTSLEAMFPTESGPEEWKKQGLAFYAKGLWKPASKCFQIANEEVWMKKCHAHEQAAKAANWKTEPRKLRLEFVKAARLFLDCAMRDEAEKCLYNARERSLLAKLHEKSGKFLKAAKVYHKEHKFLDAARNFENAGNFEMAVDCLLRIDRYNAALDVIARYRGLRQGGPESRILKHPRFDQRDESVCYQAARFYLGRGDRNRMAEALEKLPKVEDRITFLKNNGCLDRAAELLLREGKAQEAAWLMRSRGKFLDAARFSEDDKFVGDCYFLVAHSILRSQKNRIQNRETVELIEGSLKRARESYKACNDVNGQAEVMFARGKYYDNVEDLAEAWKLYYQASNVAAVAECIILLMNTEKDPRKKYRPEGTRSLKDLLDLMVALHKEIKGNRERTAVSMCQVYFGLVDTDDAQTKKVPHAEMVRFTDLHIVERDEIILAKEADKIIKDHLLQMACNLIDCMWSKHQEINDRCTSCPRFVTGNPCDPNACKYHHDEHTRAQFADRFYALLFLVYLEDIVAKFLNNMKRESAKVKNQYKQRLCTFSDYAATEQLCQLLFPRGEQVVSSHFLSERDVDTLRSKVSGRVIEFAKDYRWKDSPEDDRWCNSDLFIEVSNLMHIAGASTADIYHLLGAEERKFENNTRNLRVPAGMFLDRNTPGRFNIFSKSLERSKIKLYVHGDIVGSIHAAVKEFLFSPAKRKGLLYPSIANAVMILERQLTACLILHNRLTVNATVCLPESYLSMVNFWDTINRPKTNRSSFTLYQAIQHAAEYFQGFKGQRNFERLQELAGSMVNLTFGEISGEYNIVSDVMWDESASCVEAERVLVLVLTMLCNCDRGIPKECEKLIREQLFTLQLPQNLPQKLVKCIEDVRNARGVQDVLLCFRELLNHKPRQERLCDVMWDHRKAKDFRTNCRRENYPMQFYFQIDVQSLTENTEKKQREERDLPLEDIGNDNHPETVNEDESYNLKQPEHSELESAIVIQKAVRKWIRQKMAKPEAKELENEEIKLRFQSFKLDKTGCTICGQIQFVRCDPNLAGSLSSPEDGEETSLDWQQRSQRDTLNSHCARRSPHWEKEKSFKTYKVFFEDRVLPTMEKATKLQEEMTKLKNETIVKCSLDLDRLKDALSRLNQSIKKVEGERFWDATKLIDQAAEKVREVTQSIERSKSRKASHDGTQDSGDEDFQGDDDGAVGHLKEINRKRTDKKTRRSRTKKKPS